MSLESWKEEFYPTEASMCKEEEAAAHSLRKWKGAEKKNLKKHGVRVEEGFIVWNKDEAFNFGSPDCALCHHYYLEQGGNENRPCIECPLFIVRDGFPCTVARDDEIEDPYRRFDYHGDPEPMIAWLERVVEWERTQK